MERIVICGLGASLILASNLLMSHSSLSSSQNKNPFQSSIERGGKVYYEQCLSCHQADGGGVQKMNPPLIKTKWVLGDKTQLIQVVLNGMNGKTEINGDTY